MRKKFKKTAMQARFFIAREMVYPKDSKYLAVSLDFDLFAEGSTKGEALDRLREASIGYLSVCLEDNEPDEKIYRKAPKKYIDIYDLLKELDENKKKNSLTGFAGQEVYNERELTHA